QDQNNGYGTTCEPPLLFILEPEPETNIVTIDALEELQQQITLQNQTIEQLQHQVQKLETFNQQLL
ncbi:24626_t:CDS:2, partial [Gigaspora margarita]